MAEQPARGDAGAYARYLAAMDAAMAQKIAIAAAHLLGRGKVADMGMGSGAGSEALAALYPELEVVGVDLDPEMVERARRNYPRENLSFTVGDIAQEVFPRDSLDAIFDSSVLHHVTTYSGYDHAAAQRALAAQAKQLKTHGILIVRDFLDPGAQPVILGLDASDGNDSQDPRQASTAALFNRYAREFRRLSSTPGFPYEELPSKRPGWRRFQLSAKHAAEFLLRKDYREDWEREAEEEYTYYRQEEMEAHFLALGLRVLASTPLYNPWIIQRRWEGKIELESPQGAPLDPLPTNYVIAGERVGPQEGVRFRVAGPRPALGFLERSTFRDRATGATMELVRRPHRTIDFLPYFMERGSVFVLARQSYPRPILALEGSSLADLPIAPLLSRARSPHYFTEPLNLLERDKPLAQTVEEALRERAGVPGESILSFARGLTYYPSPGGIEEEVTSAWVEIEPLYQAQPLAPSSGFSTSGRIAAIDAQQVLRAAAVGALGDARLELNVYALLLRLRRSVGPWIGAALSLRDQPGWSPPEPRPFDPKPDRRRAFAPSPEPRAQFLALAAVGFEELSASGEVLGARALEVVIPRSRSTNTIAAAVLRRTRGEVWIAVEDRDLPAVQCFEGRSDLWTAPAWRLPHGIDRMGSALELLRARLLEQHGLRIGMAWPLGGHYHPTPGLTPEAVFPYAVEVEDEQPSPTPLHWFKLAEVIRAPLYDGHLRVAALRAAHALGLLDA
ncbi:MAG: methyltransferase domain-containing protein [Myxococcota bacterium]